MQGLEQCGLFANLSEKELRAAEDEFKRVTHPAGTEIMSPGQKGVGFLVILDGEAEVSTADGRKIDLKPGDFFGEMALLDNEGRSANVMAKNDLTVAALPEWSFKTFLVAHPEVMYTLLETVSRRLRRAQLA
ncbi:MAG: cyclic nucleotide-binding domain-containing protein [Candidatus Dormiibacterota bacterium]